VHGKEKWQRISAMGVVRAQNLTRIFNSSVGILRRRDERIVAVNAINFAVEQGQIFGLLGPNGAGKTTTIRMLATLLLPSEGQAWVLGKDVVRETQAVRQAVGYVFGGPRGLYLRLSAEDNLKFFAELYGIDPDVQKRCIPQLLELVNLGEWAKHRVEVYSRGMKQRLHIARGLLHAPPILLMDEPTIGLDPVGARELRQLIKLLASEGKTILLTTHYMFEADALCDQIAVIKRGEIIAEGSPAHLKTYVSDKTVVEIEAYGVTEERIAQLKSLSGVSSVTIQNQEQVQLISVHSPNGFEVARTLATTFGDVQVRAIRTREPTLEDAYVALVEAA
jgi:ABC-2 type transport system ATP-binding protein